MAFSTSMMTAARAASRAPPVPGASSSVEELEYGSPDMGGFTLSFMIPFERTSVFDELLVADNPLGSAPNVAFTVLAPGYYEAEVSARCSNCARAVDSRRHARCAFLCQLPGRSWLSRNPLSRALLTPCSLHSASGTDVARMRSQGAVCGALLRRNRIGADGVGPWTGRR